MNTLTERISGLLRSMRLALARLIVPIPAPDISPDVFVPMALATVLGASDNHSNAITLD
jgi:hypothetical protein